MSEQLGYRSRHRRATVTIDSDALAHNLRRVREFAPDSKVMAVIKADAYGHGVVTAARALAQADMFAVVMTAEGVELRQALQESSDHELAAKPIVVLQGAHHADELEDYVRFDLAAVIHHPDQVDMLCEASQPKALDVWLKLDSGMHRLGLDAQQLLSAHARLNTSGNIADISLMSHFANAEHIDNNLNNSQIEYLLNVNSSLGLTVSMANSAAIMQLPSSHFDVLRPGIMLYGSSPFPDRSAEDLGLRPVMQYETDVIAVKQVPAGESIGYGSTWTCERDTPVAYIGAGYGDGYPRHAESGTPVWLNGHRCPLLGRVSMDSICVDISQALLAGKVSVGDRAVLWGRELSVDEVALHSGTISYELLCHAGAANR